MQTVRSAIGPALVLVLAIASGSGAEMIAGTASGGAGATLGGSNTLATANGASFGNGVVELTTGTYSSFFHTLVTFPDTTFVTETHLSFLTGASTFEATFASEGTFQATSQILETQSRNAVNLLLMGEFTPAGDFLTAGYTPTPTTFTVAFTQASPNAAVGYTFSMTSPAVPAPASIVMGLTSLLGLGARHRFRHPPE